MFTKTQYTGSEDTGFVLVTLELVGGTSSRPFDVTVTPLEQSPVSASNNVVYFYSYLHISAFLDTSDFNSRAIIVTFNPGDVTKSLDIPVFSDNMVEYNETFNIVISLSPLLNLRIKVDDKKSIEGLIVDSTGKQCVHIDC